MHNRSEDRYQSRARVQVYIENNTQSERVGDVSRISCESRDISISGICLVTEVPLPLKANLSLIIELGVPPESFNKSGEVIWCRQVQDEHRYRVGVNLDSKKGDLLAWKHAVLDVLVKGDNR